jgi:hypothetical protein
METKTHYRKVFKSDHLGIADLEDLIEEKKSLIFTIKEVHQYIMTNDSKSGVVVAGKRISANIAFFKENIKPLVINSTNGKILKNFANGSSFVEDWAGLRIELYIDENVKMKGEIVGGVRIRPVQPTTKQKPIFTETNFDKAKTAGATIEKIKELYEVSSEIEQKYKDYAAK